METKQNNHNDGSSSNGFFLGVLLGAGITLLFTTEKGKRIVKTLTEEGLEDLSKLQDIIDTIQNEDVPPVDGKTEETQDIKEPQTAKEIAAVTEEKPSKSTSRRFFKGIRKKS